jgi:RimJ/RimL family protein N-acetyltransferase
MLDPILLDIPVPIETSRLIIRPPRPGDGPELNAAITESFQELHQWMPWASKTPSVEESEISVRNAYAKWVTREDLRLPLFDKKTGQMVGSSGFHRIDWDVPRFEIGYWVRTSFAKKGYITEAVIALTHFAFGNLGARRVEIRCDADNLLSKAIPERLGYQLEATLKNDRWDSRSNKLSDTLIFVRFDADGLPNFENEI